MHVVVQISTALLGDDDEELVNLPISLGAADLYHALETIITSLVHGTEEDRMKAVSR